MFPSTTLCLQICGREDLCRLLYKLTASNTKMRTKQQRLLSESSSFLWSNGPDLLWAVFDSSMGRDCLVLATTVCVQRVLKSALDRHVDPYTKSRSRVLLQKVSSCSQSVFVEIRTSERVYAQASVCECTSTMSKVRFCRLNLNPLLL